MPFKIHVSCSIAFILVWYAGGQLSRFDIEIEREREKGGRGWGGVWSQTERESERKRGIEIEMFGAKD